MLSKEGLFLITREVDGRRYADAELVARMLGLRVKRNREGNIWQAWKFLKPVSNSEATALLNTLSGAYLDEHGKWHDCDIMSFLDEFKDVPIDVWADGMTFEHLWSDWENRATAIERLRDEAFMKQVLPTGDMDAFLLSRLLKHAQEGGKLTPEQKKDLREEMLRRSFFADGRPDVDMIRCFMGLNVAWDGATLSGGWLRGEKISNTRTRNILMQIMKMTPDEYFPDVPARLIDPEQIIAGREFSELWPADMLLHGAAEKLMERVSNGCLSKDPDEVLLDCLCHEALLRGLDVLSKNQVWNLHTRRNDVWLQAQGSPLFVCERNGEKRRISDVKTFISLAPAEDGLLFLEKKTVKELLNDEYGREYFTELMNRLGPDALLYRSDYLSDAEPEYLRWQPEPISEREVAVEMWRRAGWTVDENESAEEHETQNVLSL